MANINTADIGFEKEIWKAADLLRGNLDASEYKSVVLGLIFLKYLSDRFEAKYNELLAEGEGFEEDKDEYTSENIFYVPQDARWSVIAAAAHTSDIGVVIDNAMRQIEKENLRLKGILPKNFARPELDKRRLGDVVDLSTNIQMREQGDTKDILGRTCEYCLSKFAEAEGKLAGEFYTPACIVRTLVEVLQPYHGRVYDPACGSGGMFVQSAKFIQRHQGNINDISVFGQDSNPTTWKMAQMNLVCIHKTFGILGIAFVYAVVVIKLFKVIFAFNNRLVGRSVSDIQRICGCRLDTNHIVDVFVRHVGIFRRCGNTEGVNEIVRSLCGIVEAQIVVISRHSKEVACVIGSNVCRRTLHFVEDLVVYVSL